MKKISRLILAALIAACGVVAATAGPAYAAAPGLVLSSTTASLPQICCRECLSRTQRMETKIAVAG